MIRRIFQKISPQNPIIHPAVFVSIILLFSACHIKTQHGHAPSLPNSSIITKDPGENNPYAILSATHHPYIVHAYGGEYYNPKLKHILAKIVKTLTAVTRNPDHPYHITILDSANVNAFALPGGYIYVTRGMLALANDTSEVAAVLAHEIAHIIANHGILRLQKKVELQSDNRTTINILAHPPSKGEKSGDNRLQFAQFSRDQELQADSIAIDMLNKAGYDPFASPRFLQSMAAYKAFQNTSNLTNPLFDFLATHPTTPQRIRLAIKKARALNKIRFGRRHYDDFLNGLDGMIFGGNIHEGYVRGNQFIHPRFRATFSIPKNFTVDRLERTVLISNPDKIAIRFDVVPMPANTSAIDYLKSGWIAWLDESSIRPITIQDLKAARARASNEHWQFDVCIIPMKDYVFRFLTAAPHHSKNFDAVTKSIAQSFHLLSSSELDKLKPLKIRIVRVEKGEDIRTLANKMQGTIHKEKLFQIINALTPTQALRPGRFVKIISE